MVIEGRKALLIEPFVIPAENIINIRSINRKFCVYCGDAPTYIAYFDVGESVLLEQYCDNCIKIVNLKTRLRLAMESHDFICRFCKIRWSIFTQTNNLCTSFGDGIHNFDFRKPAK